MTPPPSTPPPSLEVQAHNLAGIVAGMLSAFAETGIAQQVLTGHTRVEQSGPSSFRLETNSGTILECEVRVVAVGK